MKLKEALTENLSMKGFALLLAVALWLSLSQGAQEVVTLKIPVVLKNVPPRLAATLGSGTVECAITGPKLALLMLDRNQVSLVLDAAGTTEGPVAFANLDRMIRPGRGLKVIRVQPESITLKLADTGTAHQPQSGGDRRAPATGF